MSEINDGGPAFPSHGSMGEVCHEGMTLRQYAAIKLRVPNSGTDWLDDMIRKAQRDYFAAKAMQALVGATQSMTHITVEMVACESYVYADAMLRAREGE